MEPIVEPDETEKANELDGRVKPRIMVATPCYGGMASVPYLISVTELVSLLHQCDIRYRLQFLAGESLITRARNEMVRLFLKSDCTHLFFIDADIRFKAEDVLHLIEKDKPLAVGAYPVKNVQTRYVLNFKFKRVDGANTVWFDDGMAEVLDGGCGFMCIRRDVLEQMCEHYKELEYDSNTNYLMGETCVAVFDTMIDNRTYLSEDYAFCRRWQKMGGQVWLHPHILLDHFGQHLYKGDVSKIFDFKNPKVING